jgi:cob(I)alamin adenosyltransferase
MPASADNPLTKTARDLQTRNRQFQQRLTQASLQVVSNPEAGLAALTQCESEVEGLKDAEVSFLRQMADWGSQQIPSAESSWLETRLQILSGKAQALFVLARFDDALSAIGSARAYLRDPQHPAALALDQLELDILQAQA